MDHDEPQKQHLVGIFDAEQRVPGGSFPAATASPGGTNGRWRLGRGVGQALQARQQLFHRGLAQALTPPRHATTGDLVQDAISGPTALGTAHQDCSSIEGIRDAFDISVIHQIVDEVHDRRRGNPHLFRELGDAAARRLQVLEDRQMGSAQISEARLRQPIQHSLGEILIGPEQQQCRLARTRRARWSCGARHNR